MVSELRNRLAITLAHVAGVGEKLQAAMNGYNEFVGSYERRVLPQMQRIDRAGIQSIKPLPEIKPLDATARGSAAIGLFSPSETPDTAAPNTLALPADAEPSP
jgi:DNA recombination protein RmuC